MSKFIGKSFSSDSAEEDDPAVILKSMLGHIALRLEKVLFASIVTLYGDVLASLSPIDQSMDEFVNHSISTLNLSMEFLSVMKMSGLSSAKIRGVNETVLCIYMLTDKVLLMFYCSKREAHHVMFDAKSLDEEIAPAVERLRELVRKLVTFT